MSFVLHNTATLTREIFESLEPGHVRMYTCGPTVWNFAHIGNQRTNLFYDLLHRHLEFSGYRVTHVMNLTDIEDRIIRLATEKKVSIRDYVEPYEKAFLEDLVALRVKMPDHLPRATAHVPEMIAIINRLLERGHAYRADGDVYYRIDSFPAYGRLAHLDQAGLKAGARVSQDDYGKESAMDFALWKGEMPGDAEVAASWDAPFGRGRPGWHIECSAMAAKYLGQTFDIHSGAIDLLFPHHQNELAQSEGASGVELCRFWVHPAHLQDRTGAKMAKRLGNFATLRDLTDLGHDAVAIRFFLMTSAHYRQMLRFDEAGLGAAAEQVRRLRDFNSRVNRSRPISVDDAAFVQAVEAARHDYRAALDDDLNLPQAVGRLFEAVREGNAALDRGAVGPAGLGALRGLLADADHHLDVLSEKEDILEEEIERLIAEREEARARRDFSRSDEIRAELKERGIVLEDGADGVRWRRA